MKKLAKDVIPLNQDAVCYKNCCYVDTTGSTAPYLDLTLELMIRQFQSGTMITKIEVTDKFTSRYSEIVIVSFVKTHPIIDYKVYVFGDDLIPHISVPIDKLYLRFFLLIAGNSLIIQVSQHTLYSNNPNFDFPQHLTFHYDFIGIPNISTTENIYSGRVLTAETLDIDMSLGVDYEVTIEDYIQFGSLIGVPLNISGENPYGHECRVLIKNSSTTGKVLSVEIPEPYLVVGGPRTFSISADSDENYAELVITKYGSQYVVNCHLAGDILGNINTILKSILGQSS